jgi:DNA-binding PadR family transcriptional regulator
MLMLFHDRIGGMDRPVPDEVILGLLKAQPTHGYELLEVFRSNSQLGWIWTMSTSQLYAVLKRLERDGAIKGSEIVAPNAPPRVEYEITPHGETQLNAWLYESDPSPSIHRMRVLFLSRIFIANLLGTSYGEIVNVQIMACETQKKLFKARSCQEGSEIEKLTINFVIGQLESAVLWLKESNFDL